MIGMDTLSIFLKCGLNQGKDGIHDNDRTTSSIDQHVCGFGTRKNGGALRPRRIVMLTNTMWNSNQENGDLAASKTLIRTSVDIQHMKMLYPLAI